MVLVIGSLGVGLGVTLWLSTDAAERSYQLSHARETNQALLQQKEALERQVLEAQAAPALAEAARNLGMIPSRDTAHLVQDPSGNWVVVGTPKPAQGVAAATAEHAAAGGARSAAPARAARRGAARGHRPHAAACSAGTQLRCRGRAVGARAPAAPLAVPPGVEVRTPPGQTPALGPAVVPPHRLPIAARRPTPPADAPAVPLDAGPPRRPRPWPRPPAPPHEPRRQSAARPGQRRRPRKAQPSSGALGAGTTDPRAYGRKGLRSASFVFRHRTGNAVIFLVLLVAAAQLFTLQVPKAAGLRAEAAGQLKVTDVEKAVRGASSIATTTSSPSPSRPAR